MKNPGSRVFSSATMIASIVCVLLFPSFSRGPMVAVPCVQAEETPPGPFGSVPIREDGILHVIRPDGSIITSILIEIAETPEAKARGLMGRILPDYSRGMLFVYDTSDEREFWMRNTPGSLDIIFITEKGCIRSISEKTTPESDTRYRSEGSVKYVLEVRAGFCEAFAITLGTCIRWQRT
ncbi:MAG TPA: DUF192 domain-containing protein [Deltaproteobacteria bacterium]|nr:DUF192 domain-containing protein [Deltaproteobacteria bacterium]